MEAAVVVRGVVHLHADLGFGSCHDAEWCALVLALDLARAQGEGGFILLGDAVQVIEQANKALAGATPAPGSHAARFLVAARAAPPARIRWVRRAQNLAGIALAARHPR